MRHANFGLGTVKSLSGIGDRVKVVVHFVNFGKKVLQLGKAPLTKVDP